MNELSEETISKITSEARVKHGGWFIGAGIAALLSFTGLVGFFVLAAILALTGLILSNKQKESDIAKATVASKKRTVEAEKKAKESTETAKANTDVSSIHTKYASQYELLLSYSPEIGH